MPSKAIGPAVSRLATATTMAGVDTAVTLWFRLPILLARPSGHSAAEWTRAVAEKTVACHHGALDAAVTGQKALLDMMTGRMAADHLTHAMLDMAEAATAPAFRTVKANARRLSRRRRAG